MLRKDFRKKYKYLIIMLIPGIIFVGIFTYTPLFQGIGMSMQNFTLWDINDRYFNGFDNFLKVFNDSQFWTVFSNTFIWVFVSLFFQFVFGFILALLLKQKFKGRGIYQGLVFFPWAISGFLIGLIWRWIFNGQIGIINDVLMKIGLISEPIGFLSTPGLSLVSVIIANVWYGIPFFAIMILAALQSVPKELYESADIDGGGRAQKLFYVTIPYIKPILILTTLLRVIWILNFPELIYSMTGGGPAGSSHILTTYMLDKLMFNQDYGHASAAGVIIMVILLSYAVFYLHVTKFDEAGDF